MIGFALLIGVTLALAVISCTGNSESAYTSLPMILAWGATACTALHYILKKKLYRRSVAVFLLHCAFLVILAGALITHIFGSSETLHLRIGESVAIGSHSVRLQDFEVVNYPGTMAPADYISSITVDGEHAIVAMNKVYSHHGYRFFQSAYDPDGMGTILTVSHDPAGTAVSYTGYILLMIAMVWCILEKNFKRLYLRKAAILSAILIIASTAANAQPSVLPVSTAEEFGNLLVYYNGRIAPLSTLATDFTTKITGSSSYKDYTPEQVLTGWIFFYDSWKNEPCFKIKDKQTRQLLGIDGKYASMKDFFSKSGEYLPTGIEHSSANEKFSLASSAATGSLWKIFPVAMPDSSLIWLSPVDNTSEDIDTDKWHFIAHSFNYMAELVYQDDYEKLRDTVRKIAVYQHTEASGAQLPSAVRIKAEKMFTKLASSIIPAVSLICAGLILFFFSSRIAALTVSTVAFLWLAFLISLNWIASASVPMANGYETMQWMALSACLFGILMPKRYGRAVPMCAIVAGLALIVAMLGQGNPQVTQVIPVLRSPLLSMHVLSVMLAYATLALMALCGVAYLMGRKDIVKLNRALLEPAVFLLAAGIFIGAVWANQSWGRYWGWDPKEVWALITMIVYSLALHTSSLKIMRSDRFYSIFTLIAFLAVIMTYFGVNFILGGLHSYA